MNKNSKRRTSDAIVNMNSIYTHNFSDTMPNYFIIKNKGTADIYMAVNNIPTADNYDLKIKGGEQKMFGDDIPRGQIYIFNPSTVSNVGVRITSLEAPFDVVTFSLMTMADTIAGALGDNISVTTDGVVNGFECSLPAGTNVLGKVQIEGTPNVSTDLWNSRGVIFSGDLAAVVSLNNVVHINFISNDSTTNNLTFTIDSKSVTLKPGETLNNFDVAPCSLVIPAGTGRYLIKRSV